MNKLYVGNLSPDANEGTLREVFLDNVGVEPKNILVKKGGYAFVECTDQQSADLAIERLNGLTCLGTQLIVERSVSRGARGHSNKIHASNIPAQIAVEDVRHLFAAFGEIQNIEQVPGRAENTYSVNIAYEAEEQAQQALSLNDYELSGSRLKVEFMMEGKKGGPKVRNFNGRSEGGPSSGMPRMGFRQSDFPLRILVLSDMVGAIIGRQGGTIRQITQTSHARVDVHRKDTIGSVEKPITIYGNPENCSTACAKILRVMQEEAKNTNKGDICLKILAHNNLIGRIIGKNGATIKKMMEDSATKITVSSVNEVSCFNFERIITMKGSIDGMIKAERMISGKLRESFQNDLATMAPQTVMFPGIHPMAMMSTLGSYGFPPSGSGSGGRGGNYSAYQGSGSSYMPMVYPGSMYSSQTDPNKETVFLYIPNPSVGAIIGTGGSTIREMISQSGASIKVAQPTGKDEPQDRQSERKVTIMGTPESQWKAQFMVFKKVSFEGYAYPGSHPGSHPGSQEARLRAEILVPSNQVGRIIGKGGIRVRELQQMTKASIKLPENSQQQPSSQGSQSDETVVQISGDFFSSQAAQRQIRALVYRGQQPSVQHTPPPQARQGGRGRGDMGGPPPPPMQGQQHTPPSRGPPSQ